MKLCYPFKYAGDTITDFTPRVLTAANLADARKFSKNAGSYSSLRAMLVWAIGTLNGKDDRNFIREASHLMPLHSAYQALVFSGAETKGVWKAEGNYTCPKCKAVRFYGQNEDDDDGDDIRNLVPEAFPDPIIMFELSSPVTLSIGQQTYTLENITMRHPNLSDYIKAENKYPDDGTRELLCAYANAILSVNGEEREGGIAGSLLFKAFESMTVKDLNLLSAVLTENAFGAHIKRSCLKCGHVYDTEIDVSSFFDLGR